MEASESVGVLPLNKRDQVAVPMAQALRQDLIVMTWRWRLLFYSKRP